MSTSDTGFGPMSPASLLSGIERFANTVWHRSKASLNDLLTGGHPSTPTDSGKRYYFPPEIVEMIIANLIHDTPTLKASALTCSTWRSVVTPHLHRTVSLRERLPDAPEANNSARLSPLPSLHELGLLPFVKQLELRKAKSTSTWVTPAIFHSQNMRYFRAMVNLQELKIANLDLFQFPVGFREYLGHFSPTLRSVALSRPNGSRRQLLDFFRLFPMLDDIEILDCYRRHDDEEALEDQLVPVGGRLLGRLALSVFGEERLLKDLVVAFGGMRFTSMDLRDVRGMEIVLEACACTLEVLRIYPDDTPFPLYPQAIDLRCNTALRSVEVQMPVDITLEFAREVERPLSSIVSPVFSEIVFVFADDIYHPPEVLASVIRDFYGIKEFRMAFCLEASERSRAEELHALRVDTEKAVAAGFYDFLPCPPLVFSRTVASYVRQYIYF